jgi:hypothetical protein
LVTVDKFCTRAYTAVGGKLTVHDWKQVFDPAFGVVVAKSRCGRIVDRRVLIQVVTSQPICRRCEQLRAAEHKATEETDATGVSEDKKRRRRSPNSVAAAHIEPKQLAKQPTDL